MRRLIAAAEPPISRAYLRAVAQLRAAASLTDIERMIAQGTTDQLFEQYRRAAGILSESVEAAFVAAGQDTAAFISIELDLRARQVIKVEVNFDQTNVRAVRVMQENRLDLVRSFTVEQEIATREALVDAVRRGVNPKQAARQFRDSLGLTPHQVRAVNNYRRLLEEGSRAALTRALRDKRFDRTVLRAIREKTPLTSAQINRMVTRYQERFIAFRAETIARTEALHSVHEGAEQMWRQAVDDGVVQSGELVRSWSTARDARVRDSHTPMNGQKRLLLEERPFLSGNGNLLRFPGDPRAPASERIRCRCVLATRFASIEEAVVGGSLAAAVGGSSLLPVAGLLPVVSLFGSASSEEEEG